MDLYLYSGDMKVRTKTRNIIYKRMLHTYLQAVANKEYLFGLCYHLYDAIETTHHSYIRNGFHILSLFPELTKHKPEKIHVYWFPVEDSAIRIKILKQAIEETKE